MRWLTKNTLRTRYLLKLSCMSELIVCLLNEAIVVVNEVMQGKGAMNRFAVINTVALGLFVYSLALVQRYRSVLEDEIES